MQFLISPEHNDVVKGLQCLASKAPKFGGAAAQPVFALVKDQTVQGRLLAPGKVFLK